MPLSVASEAIGERARMHHDWRALNAARTSKQPITLGNQPESLSDLKVGSMGLQLVHVIAIVLHSH